MGTFNCALRLTSMDGERTLDLDALVDTGAFHTMVPGRLLNELGVKPTRRVPFRMADGRVVRQDVGEARASVNGESVTTQVVFGGDDCIVLLGAYTLEGLNLAVDPVTERLVPVEVRPG